MEPQMTGDEIVISGIAGKFPNSDNVKELQKNLLNKVDCTTDSKARWDFGMNYKNYKKNNYMNKIIIMNIYSSILRIKLCFIKIR